MRSFGLRAALVAAMVLGVASGAAYAVPPTTEQSTIGGDSSAAYSGLTTDRGLGARGPHGARGRAGRPRDAPQIAHLLRAADRLPARRRGVAGARRVLADGAPSRRVAPGGGARAVHDRRRDQTDQQRSPPRARSRRAGGASARMDFALTTGDNADNSSTTRTSGCASCSRAATLSPNSGVKSSYWRAPRYPAPLQYAGVLRPLPNEPIYTGVQDFGDQNVDTYDFYDPNDAAGPVRRMAEIHRPDGPRAADVHAGRAQTGATVPSTSRTATTTDSCRATRRRRPKSRGSRSAASSRSCPSASTSAR